MAERRTSASSISGPSLRSMRLQQQGQHSRQYETTTFVAAPIAAAPVAATVQKNPPITEVTICRKSSSGNNYEYDGDDDNRLITRSMTMKTAAVQKLVHNPTNTSKFRSTSVSKTTTGTQNAPSPIATTTTLHLDVVDDDDLTISNNITIDMIQTLPIVDSSNIVRCSNDYNDNVREYISNIIMPHCKSSCCSIRNVVALSTILCAISNFLRIQCIPYKLQYTTTTVAFHCERNGVFANIMGASLIFVIYLWYEKESNDVVVNDESTEALTESDDITTSGDTTNSGKTVLVDVQRRRGCPLDLKCIRRSLFRTLLNLDNSSSILKNNRSTVFPESIGTRQGMIPLDICRNMWSRQNNGTPPATEKSYFADDVSSTTASQDDCTIAYNTDIIGSDCPTWKLKDLDLLAHYQQMLAPTNSVEQHRMALECLCQHTDSTVTDVEESKTVVHALVCGCVPSQLNDDALDVSNVVNRFRNSLLHILIAETPIESTDMLDSSSLVSSESHNFLTTTGCELKNLQALILRAIFCSLHIYTSNIHNTNDTQVQLTIENDTFWQTVIKVCRLNIGSSNTGPCTASVSIRISSTLLSSDVVSEASKQMVRSALLSNTNNNNNTIATSDTTANVSSLLTDLQNAHILGMKHHSKLEASSKRLMEIVEQMFYNNDSEL